MKRTFRRRKGATLAFATVLALVLVILGVGFFLFSMYMGGQNETKNATDAGALNVGKQVLTDAQSTYTILPGSDKEDFFRDVTGNVVPGQITNIGDGKVNLTNINRVWAKAMFVAMNAAGAGSAAGDTDSNVKAALDGAQSISDKLVAKLTNESTKAKYFEDYARANSTRMLGSSTSATAWTGGDKWIVSLMDRGSESNIQVMDNLPIGYTAPGGSSTTTKRKGTVSEAQGKKFWAGYTPINVAGQNFWQVPFQFDQKPHLVSKTYFDADLQNTKPLPDTWDKAVPNAFAVAGKVTKPGGVGEHAMSWVQTNPRQTFPMQFPNGFVRVRLKPNKLKFTVNMIPMESHSYEPQPMSTVESGDGIPYPLIPICATAQATAYVGNEYTPPCLLMGINGNSPPFTGGQHNKPMDYILQRCKEMVPDCTMGDLCEAMLLAYTRNNTEEQVFYIYPVAGKIICTPEWMTPALPLGCSKSGEPEGSEQWDDTHYEATIANYAMETFVCNFVTTYFPVPVVTNIETSWKPGTGYNKGCLGELTVEHKSTCYMVAVCVCPI